MIKDKHLFLVKSIQCLSVIFMVILLFIGTNPGEAINAGLFIADNPSGDSGEEAVHPSIPGSESKESDMDSTLTELDPYTFAEITNIIKAVQTEHFMTYGSYMNGNSSSVNMTPETEDSSTDALDTQADTVEANESNSDSPDGSNSEHYKISNAGSLDNSITEHSEITNAESSSPSHTQGLVDSQRESSKPVTVQSGDSTLPSSESQDMVTSTESADTGKYEEAADTIMYNNAQEEPEEKEASPEIDYRLTKVSGFTPLYLKRNIVMPQNWEEFQAALTNMLDNYPGEWSLYLKNLKTGDTISINEHSMESASLIKLYIMGAVYDAIEKDTLEMTDTIKRNLDEMITVSGNEASNVLVRALSKSGNHKEGMKIVNEFIRENGYTNTKQVNGLADPALWDPSGALNITSPADCGKLLESIYNGTLVSHLASRNMENLLLNQEITYKIPAGLPKGTPSANKTGEVDGTENDTAIVYTKSCDYILCIMSADIPSSSSAISHINSISALVYDYLND